MSNGLPNIPRFRRFPRQVAATVDNGQDMHLRGFDKVDNAVTLEDEFSHALAFNCLGHPPPDSGMIL